MTDKRNLLQDPQEAGILMPAAMIKMAEMGPGRAQEARPSWLVGVMAVAVMTAGCGGGSVPVAAEVPQFLPSSGEFGTPLSPRGWLETGNEFAGIGSGGIEVSAQEAARAVEEARRFQEEHAGGLFGGSMETVTQWDVYGGGVIVLYSLGAAGAQYEGLDTAGRVVAVTFPDGQGGRRTAKYPFENPDLKQRFAGDEAVLEFDDESGAAAVVGSDERGAREVLATFGEGGWK